MPIPPGHWAKFWSDRSKKPLPMGQYAGWICGLLVIFGQTLGHSQQAHAATSSGAQLCDSAAEVAARTHSVPVAVLMAVSRTETGRSVDGLVEPWPWTVNMEGTGRWFQDQDAARAYVFRHFKNGARSFDVGCFQINYKWHHQEFRSLDEMFDPLKNALYAAKFLQTLYTELGDWDEAVGAYHSRTSELATRYLKRFRRIQANLPDTNQVTPFLSARLPLFSRDDSAPPQTIPQSRLGSLMPTQEAGTAFFITE